MKTNFGTMLSLLVTLTVALTGAETVPDSAAKKDSVAVSASAADTLKKSPDTMRIVTPVIQLKAQKDTVLLITDKDEIGKIVSTISGKVRKSRIQGYGGAGGFGPRIAVFDMSPIIELARNNDGIIFPTLNGDFTPVIMGGGLGYGGLGNGIRIGGGGWGGSRKYTSRPFRRAAGATQDSIAEVTAEVSYGGFMIEKAFVKDNWNILVGGMVGGGGLSANIVLKPAKGGSAFSFNTSDLEKPDQSADLGIFELHGGATYTVASWLHIGGDASMMLYSSINGFAASNSGTFYGAMPSIGFRIIFGNLG